jgi:imidazolonepropionase-like amidohydrolase
MRQTKQIIIGSAVLAFLACGLFSSLSEEQPGSFLITGARIYTLGPRGVLEKASLLVEGGKIKQVIEGAELPQLPTVDFTGKCLVPGFVDGHSYLSAYYGLLENTRAVTSDLFASAVFDASHKEAAEALAAGITTVHLCPRNENLIGGISSIFKVSPGLEGLHFLRKEAFLKISFAKEMERTDRPPTSLMGAERMLSEWMEKAGGEEPREEIFKERGVARLMKDEIRPLIAASNYEEINTALHWLNAWGKQGVIVGGEEAHRLADELKGRGTGVLLSPLLFSLSDKAAENAVQLLRRGLKAAFVSDMPEGEAWMLRTSALLLYHRGVSQEEALKTISLYPAEILGVASRVGSLEEGKDADLVVLSGEPLDLRSKILAVYCDGRLVHK